jgi:outer membrane protein TolC
VLGRATEAAQFAATIAEQQYEAGQADLLTVLDAQRTLLSLQQQQVSTTADLTNAHIQLYKALGGGWSTTL